MIYSKLLPCKCEVVIELKGSSKDNSLDQRITKQRLEYEINNHIHQSLNSTK